ncbi:MAG: hypothetical protein QNJ41_13350 [Xenococcaceae cyanobacterium MO_188.B32]|nr:hypothetical protein [Xenococcaceae cyanobacterium MO_188.B32]
MPQWSIERIKSSGAEELQGQGSRGAEEQESKGTGEDGEDGGEVLA